MSDRHPLDSGFGHVVIVVVGLGTLMLLDLLHPTEIGTSVVGGVCGAIAAGAGIRSRARKARERQVPAAQG